MKEHKLYFGVGLMLIVIGFLMLYESFTDIEPWMATSHWRLVATAAFYGSFIGAGAAFILLSHAFNPKYRKQIPAPNES